MSDLFSIDTLKKITKEDVYPNGELSVEYLLHVFNNVLVSTSCLEEVIGEEEIYENVNDKMGLCSNELIYSNKNKDDKQIETFINLGKK